MLEKGGNRREHAVMGGPDVDVVAGGDGRKRDGEGGDRRQVIDSQDGQSRAPAGPTPT